MSLSHNSTSHFVPTQCFLLSRCVCENDLAGELVTRLSAYPKMTEALASTSSQELPRRVSSRRPSQLSQAFNTALVKARRSRIGQATPAAPALPTPPP